LKNASGVTFSKGLWDSRFGCWVEPPWHLAKFLAKC